MHKVYRRKTEIPFLIIVLKRIIFSLKMSALEKNLHNEKKLKSSLNCKNYICLLYSIKYLLNDCLTIFTISHHPQIVIKRGFYINFKNNTARPRRLFCHIYENAHFIFEMKIDNLANLSFCKKINVLFWLGPYRFNQSHEC